MKSICILLLVWSLTANGQKHRPCGTIIGGYLEHELFDELKSLDEYEIDSDFASELGRELASVDSANGDKRILSHYGMYSSECKKCAYAKFGFTLIDFGSNCILFGPVEEFMDAYNGSMCTLLTEDELREIDDLQKVQHIWWSHISSFARIVEAQQINDSFFHFTFSSDSLMSLLGQDAEQLTISILSVQDSTHFSSTLAQVAETGYELKFQPYLFLIDELLIVFDLSALSNRYDLCLCEGSTMAYQTRLRIRGK